LKSFEIPTFLATEHFVVQFSSCSTQWRGQAKFFLRQKIWGGIMFNFRRATVLGLGLTSQSTKLPDLLQIWGA